MTEELHDVRLRVNGVWHSARVPARRLLSDCLRHDLGLTGTHVGCEHGVCGACTVLVDGDPMRSCLMLAVSAAQHSDITTVEGLAAPDGTPHPVQQAFAECHALQCGFCTPGFLTLVAAYVRDNPDPDDAAAREAVTGNLCRCTGYQNIVAAVRRTAELARRCSGSQPGAAQEPGVPEARRPAEDADADTDTDTDTATAADSAAEAAPRPGDGRQPQPPPQTPPTRGGRP